MSVDSVPGRRQESAMTTSLYNLRVDVPEGQSGNWSVNKFTVAERDWMALQYALHGRPVPAGTYTRLLQKGAYNPVMSDTPAELNDHLQFLYQAEGKVLVNGLGLGLVVKGLLLNPKIVHIDVVEISSDVISLVWPTYASEPLVHLYQADAFSMTWPQDAQWDFAWHDIWSDICTDNLPEITKLKRKYARRVGWQGAWCEGLLRRMKRRGT